MDRRWSRAKVAEAPIELPADPANWSLGDNGRLGEVLAVLVRELESTVSAHRARAIELLVEASAQEAIPALCALLQRESHLVVRWKALWALQQLAGAAAETSEALSGVETEEWRAQVISELIDQLGSERPSQRWEAAEALGLLSDPESVPALIGRLRDPHAFVRWAAAQSLGQIGSHRAIPLLLPLLKATDPLVRRGAIDALAHMDAPAVRQALRVALHDSNSSVRRSAIEAIAHLGDPEAVDALTTALEPGNDFWVRYSAAEALGAIGNQRAAAPLMEAARDRQILIRRAAVRSLGMLRASQAIPVLIQALKDSDAQVRLHAAEGLGRIGHEGVIVHLQGVTADGASVFGRSVAQAAQDAIMAIEQRIPNKGRKRR